MAETFPTSTRTFWEINFQSLITIVNVIDGEDVEAFFFAQIKTTSTGYETRRNGRRYLKVSVRRGNINAMLQYPGPAYIFGIDEENNSAYVVAVDGKRRSGFSAMPTDFEIDCNTLPELWDEVKTYWASNSSSFSSRFSLK